MKKKLNTKKIAQKVFEQVDASMLPDQLNDAIEHADITAEEAGWAVKNLSLVMEVVIV